jgi:hypothetical protein
VQAVEIVLQLETIKIVLDQEVDLEIMLVLSKLEEEIILLNRKNSVRFLHSKKMLNQSLKDERMNKVNIIQ